MLNEIGRLRNNKNVENDAATLVIDKLLSGVHCACVNEFGGDDARLPSRSQTPIGGYGEYCLTCTTYCVGNIDYR
jgi:hypothetical protein